MSKCTGKMIHKILGMREDRHFATCSCYNMELVKDWRWPALFLQHNNKQTNKQLMCSSFTLFTLVAEYTVIWGVGNSAALDDMLITAPHFLQKINLFSHKQKHTSPESWVTSHKSHTKVASPKSRHKSWVTSPESKVTNHKSKVKSSKSQVKSQKSKVPSHRSHAKVRKWCSTSHESEITNSKLRSWNTQYTSHKL